MSDHQVLTADRLASPHVSERNDLAPYPVGDGGFPRHHSRSGFPGYQNSWRSTGMKLIVCFGLPGALIAFMSFF
jgi:hypothetical protein